MSEKSCAGCGARLEVDARFCPGCGQAVGQAVTCPVCQADLILLPLLRFRPGNNFAANDVVNPAKIPHISAIPPPEQQEMAFSRDFSAFFDTFETKKR